MKPVSLLIEDFFCHSRSEIDFTQFSSALIVGRAENNDQRSNGIGKSKIFTAITYALFNKTNLKNIENVVRHGAQKCRVTFVFEAQGTVWKLVRGRGRKANSADLELYEQVGDTWKQMTERTNSQLEDELLKIIKINYETFKNSVLFAQNDFEGLASRTPEKRKALLRETLQLGDYKKLEEFAKKKSSDLSKEVDKSKAILSTYGSLEDSLVGFESELKSVDFSLADHASIHKQKTSELSGITDAIANETQNLSNQKIKIQFTENALKQAQTAVTALSIKKDEISKKIKLLKADGEKIVADIGMQEAIIREAEQKEIRLAKEIQQDIDQATAEISDAQAKVSAINAKVNELNEPLPDGPVCRHCKQVVSDEHRQACERQTAEQLTLLIKEKDSLTILGQNVLKRRNELKAELTTSQKHFEQIESSKKTVIHKQSDLAKFKTYFDDYKANLASVKSELEAKQAELQKLEEEWKSVNHEAYDAASRNIDALRKKQSALKSEISTIELQISSLNKNHAICQDRIADIRKKMDDRVKLSAKVANDEQSLLIHQQVAQAFSSKGIPTIIIHNMLDDLQVEANNIIAQIKPGIQLKFDIDKENSKGEQTDTLEISYFKEGIEHEWEQLSGGQKLVITFALRLALSTVIQRNYGTDLKILLLDEIDASLDKESLELLFELIKLVEQQFKVLLITHNDALKDKFTHAILVEQDQNLNSTAKIVSSW